MNILFFLTPKENVSYLPEDYTLRQALEKMKYHGYSAVPVLTSDGRYVGTVTEGDLLWAMMDEARFDLEKAELIFLRDMERRRDNRPVTVNTDMDDLVDVIKDQNFVPVIDDKQRFIGIVTRKDVIEFYYREYQKAEQKEEHNETV